MIGKGIINDAIAENYGNHAVITDKNVARLYAGKLDAKNIIELEPGEGSKSFAELERILDFMLDEGINRNDAVVAIGGGVVGDIAGLAAAIFKRGIDFIQVPTTLLAMVDSSVGGKVAVNLSGGKNMVGAFYQPKAVYADISTLDTLNERQYAAGMAEVIKYGYIADADMLASLKEKSFDVESIIFDCCSIKADYVAKDPFDTGVRMQLNYGHTIGHAIETAAGYGNTSTARRSP
jgi:3-dehydroquinate synthase